MIDLQNITLKLGNRFCFKAFSWRLNQGEQWALIGQNGAGKTVFLDILTNKKRLHSGIIKYDKGFIPTCDIAIVSFELQKELFEKDNWNDNSNFMKSAFDQGTTAAEAILRGDCPDTNFTHIVKTLRIGHILEQGIRFLSTGEIRKVLIARALLKQPKLLILDNPFEGLDQKNRKEVETIVAGLYETDLSLIFSSRRMSELPTAITHIIHFANCEVTAWGKKQRILQQLQKKTQKRVQQKFPSRLPGFELKQTEEQTDPSIPLVRLNEVTVKYGKKIVLNKINWHLNKYEHWCIAGPNGAGKSTLLNMISGENSKAYGKEVYLFGKKRGTGESVWDIKARFGIVSSALQTSYIKGFTAFRVIESGFFDTIGVYDRCTPAQNKVADEWLAILSLTSKRNYPFNQLSFGEQKLILLARAMVKLPPILILDEPCLGLDETNRKLILKMIDFVAATSDTSVVYVSHDPYVTPKCITHHFVFKLRDANNYDYQISRQETTPYK
jgi:molybdate transport system ATP-binding protein